MTHLMTGADDSTDNDTDHDITDDLLNNNNIRGAAAVNGDV